MTDDFLRWVCRLGLVVLTGCVEEPEIVPFSVPSIAPSPTVAFPPPLHTRAAAADTWYADCGNGLLFAMADVLPAIAEGMADQNIPYRQSNPDEWRDCSGNFLRLSSYLASACPAGMGSLAAPPGIVDYVPGGPNVPDLEPKARSSRDLARWYHEQGRFVPIWYDEGARPSEVPASLEQHRYLLKAGAVLWFSRKRPLEANGLEQLFARNRRDTQIVHLGAVVQVEHDEDGEVVAYAMYHGGNPSRVGSVTDGHGERGTGGGPPFGNGGEYLVGIGSLLPVAEPPNDVTAEERR